MPLREAADAGQRAVVARSLRVPLMAAGGRQAAWRSARSTLRWRRRRAGLGNGEHSAAAAAAMESRIHRDVPMEQDGSIDLNSQGGARVGRSRTVLWCSADVQVGLANRVNVVL